MPSHNERNSIIFAGTMGLIRRSALEGLRGWDEARRLSRVGATVRSGAPLREKPRPRWAGQSLAPASRPLRFIGAMQRRSPQRFAG
jgi:hypothetical protein